MKKTYVDPELFVMVLKTDDVITTSPIQPMDAGDGDKDFLNFAF